MKSWLVNTKIYQIYFVRAPKKRNSAAILYWLWIVLLMSFFVTFVHSTDKVYKLSEMKTGEGIFIKYTKPRKSDDKVYFKDANGNIRIYVSSLKMSYDINNLIGKHVKYYYAKGLCFFIKKDCVYEMEFEGKKMFNYNYKEELIFQNKSKNFSLYSLAFSFIPLIIIFLLNRNDNE